MNYNESYSPNELAYLDLINDISKTFCFVGEEWEPAICDGDMKSLDKAVKKFNVESERNDITEL